MSDDKPEPIVFGDRELSDVSLVVEEQEFPVHKMILANHSDVFKAMFFRQFKEANEDRVEIKDVPASAFQHLMEIVYHGKFKGCAELFPGRCYLDEIAPSLDIRDVFCHDSGMLQLLEAADQFNMTKKTVNAIKDDFNQLDMPCLVGCEPSEMRETRCARCICLYLILLDRDGTIKVKRKFDRSLMAKVAREIARLTDKFIPMDDAKLEYIANLLEHVVD